MFKPRFVVAAAALAALALPALAQAPELSAQAWTVDHSQSRLGFSAVADGGEFGGQFGSWDAEIQFDPAKLSASWATVSIGLASVTTEDSSRSDSLQGSDWFAVAMFPKASFTTQAIRAEGDGYVADGTLTIRDQSKPVSLPFTVAIDGDVARMKGELTIDRKAFGVGGGYEDGHVDPQVTVEISVVAKKA